MGTLLSCYPCCTAENKVTQVNSTLNRVLIEAFINFYSESMSEENSCCGFKRKTVCMSLIGLCCLSLVVWTVVVTATPIPTEEGDMSIMNGTNLTMAGVCPLNSTFSIDNVSISLSVPKLGSLPLIKKIKLSNQEENKTHCKCLCQYNVTETELLDAIKELQRMRMMKKKEENKIKD